MSELKPCPFCGGAPQSVERPDNIDGTRFFYALACYCGGYSACAHKMAVEPTPEQAKRAAIEAWNRRAQPAQAGRVPITSETGNAPDQGASAITSESGKAGQVLSDEKLWEMWVESPSDVLRFARAIEQAVLAKRVPQWLPIETAPKDGTRVLLAIDHGEWGDAVWTGLWADGWIVSYGKAQATPTHWMPIPPPPGIVGEKGGA